MWSGFSFFGTRPLDTVGTNCSKPPPPRPDSSELFVGGIPADTTISTNWSHAEELKTYFGEFGAIEECRMKEDKLTSRFAADRDKFRGFGFIRFKEPKSVQLVLAKKHTLKGSPLDVKKAITKEENEKHVNDELLRKIFLAHINSKLSECRSCLTQSTCTSTSASSTTSRASTSSATAATGFFCSSLESVLSRCSMQARSTQ